MKRGAGGAASGTRDVKQRGAAAGCSIGIEKDRKEKKDEQTDQILELTDPGTTIKIAFGPCAT